MKMPMPKKDKFQGPPYQHLSCRMNFHKYTVFKAKAKKEGFSMNKILENWVDVYIEEGK